MKFIIPEVDELTMLSLDEIGLLTTMLNVDEADYCTIEKLCMLSSDSSTNIVYILNLLLSKGYIKLLYNGKYCVNKEKIIGMKFVHNW